MKLNNIYWVSGIVLITIGLWDFYSLRLMTEQTIRTENQQLSPAITGAIILILSPLFHFKPAKILILLISILLIVTIAILITLTMVGTYADFNYLARHIFGEIFLAVVLIINIRQIKQGESKVK
jgi:hypothetical protein